MKTAVVALAEHYDSVVRYNGGPNAGHTIYHKGEKHVLHVIPSGIFYPNKQCLITSSVVVDLTKLVSEINALKAKNISCNNLKVSPDCHLILPYHIFIDQIRETRKAKLGTTKSGIGPCYADRTARIGIRIKDLFSPEQLREALEINLLEKNPLIVSQGYAPLDVESLYAQLLSLKTAIEPYVADVRELMLNDSKAYLFEGAQGVMLDIDHGTYPYVTSSQSSYGGLLAGTGLPAKTQIDVLGVIKAYNTRVGTGPFPTEDKGEVGERIRTQGKEFGSTTGRPRRCGWLDVPQLKYAISLSGAKSLAMTKLDVLSGFSEIQVCWMYKGEPLIPNWETAIPCWTTFEGFVLPDKIRGWLDLPLAARRYVKGVQDLVGIPITHISVGPHREDMFPTTLG